MRRRVLAAVGVALLLSTAGCGGVLGGETRTPYEVAPTPTATPTETPPSGGTPRATATPRAPPDLVTTLSEQDSRLRRLDSYTLQSNWTATAAGQRERVRNFTFRIDRFNDRGIQFGHVRRRPGVDPLETVVYHGDGSRWLKRVAPNGETTYRALPTDGSRLANETEGLLRNLAGQLSMTDLTRNGTAEFAGEEMARYTATGVDAAPPSAGEDIDGYRVTLLVDDGLVRLFEAVRVEDYPAGDALVTRHRVSLTGIDDTSVRRPEWVDPASTPGESVTVDLPEELASALDGQESRLRNAESYTVEIARARGPVDAVRPYRNTSARVDHSEREALARTRYPETGEPNRPEYVAYRNGSTRVARVLDDGTPTYLRLAPDEGPGNASASYLSDLTEDLARVDFERNGSVQFDGNAMARYTAVGAENAPPGLDDVVEFRATVLVDDDGIVRSIRRRIVTREGGMRTVNRLRVEVVGIGTTTVERPAWVDEAIAETGEGTTTKEANGGDRGVRGVDIYRRSSIVGA